jgi:hypothetical protein
LDSNNALVVGQKNIHDKIQQLGFRDCHAKISHVDAQATLGEGVVVQVSGELSNDGQPMRRFTQTFVLACQSPKKYYVHNDIFRYQDIYTDDDENNGNGRQEQDEESDGQSAVDATPNPVLMAQPTQQQPPQQQQPVQPTAVYYAAPGVMAAPPQNIIPNYVQPAAPVAQVATAPAQVNGHDDILKNMSTQTTQLPTGSPAPAQVIAAAPVVLPVVSPQPSQVLPPMQPIVAEPQVVAVPNPTMTPEPQVVIPVVVPSPQQQQQQQIQAPPQNIPAQVQVPVEQQVVAPYAQDADVSAEEMSDGEKDMDKGEQRNLNDSRE